MAACALDWLRGSSGRHMGRRGCRGCAWVAWPPLSPSPPSPRPARRSLLTARARAHGGAYAMMRSAWCHAALGAGAVSSLPSPRRGAENSAVWWRPILRGSWGHVVSPLAWANSRRRRSFGGSRPLWSPGAPHEVALSSAGSPRRGGCRHKPEPKSDKVQQLVWRTGVAQASGRRRMRGPACRASVVARTPSATVKPPLRIQRALALLARAVAQKRRPRTDFAVPKRVPYSGTCFGPARPRPRRAKCKLSIKKNNQK